MAASTLQTILSTVKDAALNVDAGQVEQLTGFRTDSVDEFLRKTEHTGPKNYGRGFLAGVLGGIVGVGVKMMVDRAVAPETEQFEDKIAGDVVDAAERVTGIELTEAQEGAAEAIVEVGIGALIGGMYGLMVEALPEAKAAASGDQGGGAFAVAQQLAIPALGVVPATAKDVAKDKIENLAGHIAFVATAEIVRRASRYYMEQ
ncbi:MAG: hypothetical protein AAF840_02380 [Bacteroidota bacterium]